MNFPCRPLRYKLIGVALFACAEIVAADAEISVPLGLRNDELRWSIAGPQRDPNIISELTWDDVRSRTVGFQIVARADLLNMKLAIERGSIVAGDNQDSDYGANDRGCEFSRSNNNAGGGDVNDVSLSFGYEFPQLTWERSQLVPFVGYAQRQLDFTMTDGRQTLSNPLCVPRELAAEGFVPYPVGPIPGLDSSYSARWKGVHAALEWRARLNPRSRLRFAVLRHQVDYVAKADWNLREDFAHPVSFEHRADGIGKVVAVGFDYEVVPRVVIGLGLARSAYRTGRGVAYFFGDDGGVGAASLNPVTWNSRSYTVTVTGVF